MVNFILVFCIISIIFSSTLNIFSYRLGLKDGLNLIQGKPLEDAIKIPKVEFKKEEKLKEDIITEGLNNLMTYDGGTASKKE
jgi:hypothetical protein